MCKNLCLAMVTVLEQHRALTDVAIEQNCTSSSLEEERVSMHTLPQTASFSNVGALASATNAPTYIGTSASEMVFSAHLLCEQEGAEEEEEHRPKKRRRGVGEVTAAHNSREVAAARERLEKSVPDLSSAELDVAQRVITRLANELRGSDGEIVVESTVMLAKKLGPSDTRQRVVIAARLNAGIAMRVDALRNCLGECWSDGLLTTQTTLHGIGKIELPLSEEARAAESFGNAAILLVTSVGAK